MKKRAVMALLRQRCSVAELVPQYWNTFEPVNHPFDPENMERCAENLVSGEGHAARASVLLEKRKTPKFWGDIELFRSPKHNNVYVALRQAWPSGEQGLAELVRNCVRTTEADFGFVADPDEADVARFNELLGPYTPEEIRLGVRRGRPFIDYFYFPILENMYGPHGYLWDIVWYNYFGPPYVELIGKDRLTGAGWARVEPLAGGFECYATERIDDPSLRDKRAAIRQALDEFVWTPGCKREDKLAPVFDFSAQLEHAPPLVKQKHAAGTIGKENIIIFAGMTKEQEQQAIKALEEQSGKQFDPVTRTLQPKKP